MRKRGRKGGRFDPDFSGPYTIQDIAGKCVRLKNTEGATLKNHYSIDHIKPYRRSHHVNVSDNEKYPTHSQTVNSSTDLKMPPCHPTANPQCQQSPEDTRPSIIQYAPKMADKSCCSHKEFNSVPGPETRGQELPSRTQSLENEGGIVNNSFWPVGHLLPVWRCNMIDHCMTLFAFCSLQLILDVKKHATCTELVEVWKWICLSVIFSFAHPLYLSYFSA